MVIQKFFYSDLFLVFSNIKRNGVKEQIGSDFKKYIFDKVIDRCTVLFKTCCVIQIILIQLKLVLQ